MGSNGMSLQSSWQVLPKWNDRPQWWSRIEVKISWIFKKLFLIIFALYVLQQYPDLDVDEKKRSQIVQFW